MAALLVEPLVMVVQVEQAPVMKVSVVEANVVESIVAGVGYGILIGSPAADKATQSVVVTRWSEPESELETAPVVGVENSRTSFA